jgi:hypothetical protein
MKLPKWALETYPGEEKDASKWLEEVAKGHVFKKIWGAAMTSGDRYIIRRAEANIKLWVLQRTKDLSSTWDRAFLHQLDGAEQTGWYHDLDGELDSLEELLAAIANAQEEGTGEYSDRKYLVETVVPILEQAGAKMEEVWGLATATSKARAAVAPIRHVLDREPNKEKISPKAKKQVLDIVKDVTNTKMTVKEFRQLSKAIQGKATDTPDPIPAMRFLMGKDQEVIMIRVPTRAHSRAIELALKNKIISVFDVRDPFGLLKEIQEMVKKGEITRS